MPRLFFRSWIAVVSVLALAGIIRRIARADDPERPALSPQIRRVLAWLPETTETIVVGQSFTIPVPERDVVLDLTPKEWAERFHRHMPYAALGALDESEMKKYVKPLDGKKVALALRGGRNYELITSTLPTYRTEGCAIVIFEKELGEAGTEWVKMLRAGAKEVRQISGRNVFVFPPTEAMRPSRESKWPGKLGVYLVLLNADTILCATSDKYLEQLLERIDAPPASRALPDDLPEWKHVDPVASAWMLRHIPKPGRRPVFQGVTWSVTKDQIQAFYLPVAGEETAAAGLVRREWLRENIDIRPKIDRVRQGTAVVVPMNDGLSDGALWASFFSLYYLEAQRSSDEFEPDCAAPEDNR